MKKQLLFVVLAATSVLTVEARLSSGKHQESVNKMTIEDHKYHLANIKRDNPAAYANVTNVAKMVRASGDVKTPKAKAAMMGALTNVLVMDHVSSGLKHNTGHDGGTIALALDGHYTENPESTFEAIANPAN